MTQHLSFSVVTMLSKRRARMTAVLGVTVALITAASVGALAAPAQVPQSPFPAVDSPGPITYPGTGLVSRPAAPDATPRVSQDEALQSVEQQQFPEEMMAGRPESSLRLLTFAPEGLTDAELVAAGAYSAKLSWVFEYGDSRLDVHGPPELSAKDRSRVVETSNCSMIFAVDAMTGTVDQAYQVCEPVKPT